MSGVGSGSKELLPVGGRPVLDWVLAEGRKARVDRSIVVVSPVKSDLVEFVSSSSAESVIQEVASGLAPATILASGVQDTLLLLPDTLFWPQSPSAKLVQAISKGFDVAIAVEQVADEDVSRYGIVEWSGENGRISRIVEKPKPAETPSRWAIAGRFAMSARTMEFVRRRVREIESTGTTKEIDLPPLLSEAIAAGHTGLAVALELGERRFDCGNPEGYRRACEVVNADL